MDPLVWTVVARAARLPSWRSRTISSKISMVMPRQVPRSAGPARRENPNFSLSPHRYASLYDNFVPRLGGSDDFYLRPGQNAAPLPFYLPPLTAFQCGRLVGCGQQFTPAAPPTGQ